VNFAWSTFQSKYESERLAFDFETPKKKVLILGVCGYVVRGYLAVGNGFIVIHGKMPGSPSGELSTYP
jgi:hypothetical protein